MSAPDFDCVDSDAGDAQVPPQFGSDVAAPRPSESLTETIAHVSNAAVGDESASVNGAATSDESAGVSHDAVADEPAGGRASGSLAFESSVLAHVLAGMDLASDNTTNINCRSDTNDDALLREVPPHHL